MEPNQFNLASMKVPPKRKGNDALVDVSVDGTSLNESPSEKEGKSLKTTQCLRVKTLPQ